MALWMSGRPRGAELTALAMILCCAPVARAVTSHLQLAPRKTAAEARATQLQASLVWKEVTPSDSDVYMSLSVDLGYGVDDKNARAGRCNSGYLGAQFHRDGHNTLLWSMSGLKDFQAVPVSEYCHYDCFDCSPPNHRDFQCTRNDYKLSFGVNYTFTMQMEMQNASGAMWSVTVFDPTAAHAAGTVEVGRVFFKDSEFGLPEKACRVLGVDPYAFQEYFHHAQSDHTTRASWSAITFSGAMKPQDAEGYCEGGTQGSLAEFAGLSRADCKGRCVAEEKCRFASFADNDALYAKGSHCLLFAACEAKAEYKAELWWTYEKVDAPMLAAASIEAKCKTFKDQNCKDRIETVGVVPLPGGAPKFEFEAGPDVRCIGGGKPEAVESDKCAARGRPRPPGPTSPTLRGSALAASAIAATPQPEPAAAAEEVRLLP